MEMYGFFDTSFGYDRQRQILSGTDCIFGAKEKVSVLVPQGSGKTTLLKLLRRRLRPRMGQVKAPPGISWPVGTASAFHPALTGEENIRHIAMLLGGNAVEVSNWIEAFTKLGSRYSERLSEYSSGERARLSYALSYAIPREFYLSEDDIATGDQSFRDACAGVMNARLKDAGLFLVTRNPKTAAKYCERYFVLETTKFVEHMSSDDAAEHLNDFLTSIDSDKITLDFNEVG